ncbi:uncharacterized protein EI97DRAFT_431584 [Westerdykella ornata]|uniref:Zn(2)-C6 fungal-type domain-containing protein n=1 Tax=Westerdykella ornata TaxID=318751 RepID=A0A6A6JQE7_WESOR|nr:uncharacterized protein EI97DRAFT_431584 [Westerdykella ornata]KAF2278343.1 hypothetical protein EI97DRAFT_431584 [Westerdykella ornata]
MYETDAGTIVRCELCNKPFDKPSTLKRHGYYCRSRKGVTSPRSRSCIACARGKVRCNNARPTCSRCSQRNLTCIYPTSKGPNTTRSRLQGNRNASLPASDSPLPRPRRPSASVNTTPTTDSTVQFPHDAFNSVLQGEDYLDTLWSDDFRDLEFPLLVDPQSGVGPEDALLQITTPNQCISYPDALTVPTEHELAQIPQVNLTMTPTQTPRAFTNRSKLGAGALTIANLMKHMLNSYPLLIHTHNSLPPFIHPRLLSQDARHGHLESLANCINLVRMVGSGIQGSGKLFWKNVRLECERLLDEHRAYTKWELLAGMQALSIYAIKRLGEGETDDNNVDHLLVMAIAALARRLGSICYDDAPTDQTDQSSWEEWIFDESRRRLAIIFRALNMLVYFDPAALCEMQPDLIIAALPAGKHLWQANDQITWKAEIRKEPDPLAMVAVTANGELVRLDDGQQHCGAKTLRYSSASSQSFKTWEEWCSGTDEFGSLVMLIASFIGVAMAEQKLRPHRPILERMPLSGGREIAAPTWTA